MKKHVLIAIFFIITAIAGCKNGENNADASGTFEVDEVVVSSELSGKLISFTVEEGMIIPKDSVIGVVDAKNISLQQEQVEASIKALNEKTADVNPQVQLLQNQLSVQQSQLNKIGRAHV